MTLTLNKSPKTKIVIFIVSIVTLLVISETLYTFQNDTQVSIPLYIYLSSILKQKDAPISLYFLNKAAEIKLKEVKNNYPELSIDTSIEAIPKSNSDLNDAYSDHLKNIDYEYLLNSYAAKWAVPYYQLGLVSYKHSEVDLLIHFWGIAAKLAPEWSYFHVELANYYLNTGDIEKATAYVEYCLNFHSPQEHCREFLKDNVETNTSLPVGSWEDQINNI